MSDGRGVRAVQNFWNRVWSSQNPDAIDELVVEDFLLVSGGVEIRSRQAFKQWVIDFLSVINDLEFEEQDSFQNADGTRVVSMWHLAGTNNGVLGTEPNGEPIEMVGTAVWEVREDGMLMSNRVERNALELYRKLTGE